MSRYPWGEPDTRVTMDCLSTSPLARRKRLPRRAHGGDTADLSIRSMELLEMIEMYSTLQVSIFLSLQCRSWRSRQMKMRQMAQAAVGTLWSWEERQRLLKEVSSIERSHSIQV
jgi:hypothetical protein